MRKLLEVAGSSAAISFTRCGYKPLQSNDEQIKSGCADVENTFRRSADLRSLLVKTVKAFVTTKQHVMLGAAHACADQ